MGWGITDLEGFIKYLSTFLISIMSYIINCIAILQFIHGGKSHCLISQHETFPVKKII